MEKEKAEFGGSLWNASPAGDLGTLTLSRLNPGPGVCGLMSIASHYGLADIDVVGLRPVASLLD